MMRRADMVKRNNAQVFIHDLMIALFIISIFFVIFLNFESNGDLESEDSELMREAKVISDYLVSSGYPDDWNITSVIKIGLTNGDNVLNITKLDYLYNLTKEDYDDVRYKLGSRHDFLMFFTDYENNIVRIGDSDYYGRPDYNVSTLEASTPSKLFKVSRFIVLKSGNTNISSQIVEMRVYVWKN